MLVTVGYTQVCSSGSLVESSEMDEQQCTAVADSLKPVEGTDRINGGGRRRVVKMLSDGRDGRCGVLI